MRFPKLQREEQTLTRYNDLSVKLLVFFIGYVLYFFPRRVPLRSNVNVNVVCPPYTLLYVKSSA